MFIEWTDLCPGDIVELNPDFLVKFKKDYGRKPYFRTFGGDAYMKTDEDQLLVIKSVKYSETIGIDIELEGYKSILIIPSTGALFKLPDGPSLFRVVSLAED